MVDLTRSHLNSLKEEGRGEVRRKGGESRTERGWGWGREGERGGKEGRVGERERGRRGPGRSKCERATADIDKASRTTGQGAFQSERFLSNAQTGCSTWKCGYAGPLAHTVTI